MPMTNKELMEIAESYNCMKPRKDNEVIEILEKVKASNYLKDLRENLACRTCPVSVWMMNPNDLICYCPRVSSIVWQSSNPTKCEVILCSARKSGND